MREVLDKLRLFTAVLLLLALSTPAAPSTATSPGKPDDDLSRHPLYSRYDFGNTSGVINFGTQPLAVPIGVIGEVMQRDRILTEELGKIGLEIRFHPFLKGDDINFFLRRGRIDAAMGGDMPTIVTASSFDILVTALAKQGYSSIVTRGHFTIRGLKGKRIGYPPVSNAHYALLAALESAGLKESEVRMVPMEVSEVVEAFTSGRIDAFAAWEPISSVALKRIHDAAAIYRYLNSSYLYFGRSLLDRHPEAASLIVASMVRALGWMKGKQDHLLLAGEWTLAAGKRLRGKPVPLSASEIALLTMKDILSITSSPIIPERDLAANGAIRKKFDFLKVRGQISTEASWERLLQSFDRATIAKVLANPKRYRLNSFDYAMEKPDR
ncbi:MAG: NrtA/SsuA/CpmA family ABC transporter substrate-binding protein [Deltaproteobacteria bacterium]|nr:NrtA/SsuA/CpmA family ABC transporter substrate-binding protein [Deltaproteobacteria bacterium]